MLKPDTVRAEIERPRYQDDLPQLRITVGNCCDYGFTLAAYPEKNWEWLRSILERQFQEAVDRAFIAGQKSVQTPIKEALGL